MIDSLYIGETPHDEECVPTQDKLGYTKAQKEQCKAFIAGLRNILGQEPEGAKLFVKSNSHDFGNYYSVECKFDDNFPKSIEYAYNCESFEASTWEDCEIEAKLEILNGEYSFLWRNLKE